MSMPPAHPAYIFRGHAAQIHSTTFIRSNSRLVSGDAEGWIVLWSMTTKRATAVWHAHEGAILGSAAWGSEMLITHGKDNKLCVWKLREEDESEMSTSLPVDGSTSHRKQPWLLHALPVNTLNFCSFASCAVQGSVGVSKAADPSNGKEAEELFIAVPNVMSSESVDVFHLPSEKRIHTVSGDKSVQTGMVMAVSIFYIGARLTVIAGYESGHTMISQLGTGLDWQVLYLAQPHSQPILSLAVAPNQLSYVTSSADAIIAKHPIPEVEEGDTVIKDLNTQPVATSANPATAGISSLSTSLQTVGNMKNTPPRSRKREIQTTPLKIVQTKHSGQQDLRIRSDGKILATAGWDSRLRVYSLQTLKELAVLKWHKEGCYAVAFAEIRTAYSGEGLSAVGTELQAMNSGFSSMNLSVKEQREMKATTAHWLAAGSKDGKVSLWDIY